MNFSEIAFGKNAYTAYTYYYSVPIGIVLSDFIRTLKFYKRFEYENR